ncbi:unnamed protein product [Prorocentrum cordatum]|uniref:Uncharacterized protein n=1 Tax=Prorocentrum cordatum TaxID=2364126 RepID=A0ABN9W382_9DINO|nr:unnamed protein product [Polarella glacialis]
MAEQLRKSRQELQKNTVAGTLTGATTICLTQPLDTLRCRWQVASGQTLVSLARGIVADEGLWGGLWRPGFGPNVLGMAIAVGGRNGFYPTARDAITWLTSASLVSGMASYLLASPLLQAKTQLQAEAGRVGPDGLYATGAKTLAAEGAANGGGPLGSLRALWRGAGVIVGRGAVLSASQLMAYDRTKTGLKESGAMDDGKLLHLVASQAAAACCTTCSMPLDVVLTVYQSAHSLGGERRELYGSRGPLHCAGVMLRESGPLVFMRGWVPAFMRLSPTCTFSFFLYEQLRRLVGIGYLD